VSDAEARASWRVNGVWDAVDTSPGLGGQNVFKNLRNGYLTKKADDTNGIRESFLLKLKNIFLGGGGYRLRRHT